MPDETLSLQNILFTYPKQKHWYKQQQKLIIQTWVHETGAQIQEDAQYQIKQQTACDITLTVTLQSPQNKKFRCWMIVDEQAKMSVELWVRVSGLFNC